MELTQREKKVLEYIKKVLSERGYSPSVRDIQNAVGIKSTSTVQTCLERLEEGGFIYKEDGKSRTIRVDEESGRLNSKIPILGYVRAGSPLNADENFDGFVDFIAPKGYDRENLFALRVTGDSMKNAGILDGDVVIVDKTSTAENGDIVAALVDDGATVKTFYRENGKFRLQPQNDAYKPIISDDVTLLGRVIARLRNY